MENADLREDEVEEFTGDEAEVDGDVEDDDGQDDGQDDDGQDDDGQGEGDDGDDDGALGVLPPHLSGLRVGPGVYQPRIPRGVPAQELEARDPSEVLRDLHFDSLSDRDQAEALRASGGRVESSADRARRHILQERELGSRAVAYREYPEEWQGTKISGRVRAWKAPYTIAEIEDWLATYRGGGKYKIQLYMGNGRYLDSKVLDVEGDPLLPGAREQAEEREREERGMHAAQHDDRASALERQLAEERFERRMAEERSRTDVQMGQITHAMQAVAEALKQQRQQPTRQPVDFAALAASVGPLVIAYLNSQDAKAAEATKQAREDRKALIEQQNAAEKRMMQMMQALQGKKETLSDAIKAMAEVKKLTGGENSEARAFNKILDTALPKLIDATTKIQLHKAGVTESGDDEEFGAKMIVDRVTDLATAFISSRGERQAPGPRPGMPQPAQMTHGAYGLPAPQQAPPPQPAARSGGPIVTPEEQAAHEAAMLAARQHGGAPVQTPAPAPQGPAPAAPPQQVADVNFAVFDRALQYMSEGKYGSELADDLMREEHAHQQQRPGMPHLYLSPRVVQYLCVAQPDQVLRLLNPQIAQEPRFASLLDTIGQTFLADFCIYFSQPDESQGASASGDDNDNDGNDGADDLTGGATGGDA